MQRLPCFCTRLCAQAAFTVEDFQDNLQSANPFIQRNI
jgi:hypothetical protein